MKTLVKALLSFFAVDLFFFSSRYVFLGSVNTKMLMAVVGAAFFMYDVYRTKGRYIPNEFLMLVILSLAVSLAAVFSSVIHNTRETGYHTYFASMTTWIGAAYGSVRLLKEINGTVNFTMVCKYLVYAAVVQGIVAFFADRIPALDNFVLSIVPGMRWVKSIDRLYGFAETACLDTGGIRFGIASMVSCYLIKSRESRVNIPLFILFFCIICVTGNMVARTTVVGVILGLVYLLMPTANAFRVTNRGIKVAVWFLAIVAGAFFGVAAASKSNPDLEKRLRFGFEGFYSLAETGHWHTASNSKLESMYVWPDNLHTWILGDGYFDNPSGDKNFLGERTGGFYKDTDVGYLRFIYYFGLIGLAIFSIFILYAGSVCVRKYPRQRLFMLMMTALNFVIWLKVATDCFFILSLWICYAYVRDNLPGQFPDETTVIRRRR